MLNVVKYQCVLDTQLISGETNPGVSKLLEV